MSEEVAARAFDPFFTTKFTGRGLGLSSVQRIVSRHGGAITIQSEQGRGTTMRVLLPRAPRQGGDRKQARGETNFPLILIVDDESSVRRVARRVLERRGYRCLEAESAEQTVEAVKHNPDIAAILLDVVMPGRTGIEALAELRLYSRALPVLVVSGFPEAPRPQGDPHAAFLAKPFSPEHLDEALQRLLRSAVSGDWQQSRSA